MQTSDFPSEQEQELVRKYVLERPLYRPSVTYFKAFLLFFVSALCLFAISVFVFRLFRLFGAAVNKVLFFTVFYGVAFVVFARWVGVLCIRLYQHYAPEEVRRRCLLKPTCSEYAVIVIKKYGLLIGGIKTWIRLYYKCRGDVYYIDEPS